MPEAAVRGMTVYLWFGLVGPSSMPNEIVKKLQADVRKAIEAAQ
jgi:hypothetical protein